MFDEQVSNTLALSQSIQKYLRHISLQSKPSMKLRMEKVFNSPSAKVMRRLQWGKSQSQQQQQQQQLQQQLAKAPATMSRSWSAQQQQQLLQLQQQQQQDAPSSPRASQSPASPENLPPMPSSKQKSNTISGRLNSRVPLPLPLTQPKYPSVFE